MKKSTYRALVAGSVVLPALGLIAEVAFDLVPAELKELSDSLLMQADTGVMDWI
jgi:hypothetical protein